MLVNVSSRMGLPCDSFSFTEKHGISWSQDWQAEQQRELTSKLLGVNKNLNDLSFLEERVSDPGHVTDTNK